MIVYYEKNIKYGENKHNGTRSGLFIHTKTASVTIQGNITATRYRNDVIRSVLLHIRANLGMMLARDTGSCHAARSTVVMFVAKHVQKRMWPAKVRAHPLQLNLRELTRVIHQMCAAIPQKYIYRHILSMRTRFLVIDATPGGCTK